MNTTRNTLLRKPKVINGQCSYGFVNEERKRGEWLTQVVQNEVEEMNESKPGTIRMSVTVDDDIPALLANLAGSKRFMGQWLTDVLRNFANGEHASTPDAKRVAHDDANQRLCDIEQRLASVERAIIANLQVEKNDASGGQSTSV